MYDGANRMTQRGASSFTYDVNGNVTNDGGKLYVWNARDQLTGMSGDVSATFGYDAVGRRHSKTVGGATTHFLYDKVDSVQELRSDGTPIANLFKGPGIDETLARSDGTGTNTQLVDALGSSLALVDMSGSLKAQYTYDPFGLTSGSG